MEDLPTLAGQLRQAELLCEVRLRATPSIASGNGQGGKGSEHLLTPEEAACIARVPVKWLFRRTKGLRFRRNLSRKRILFEESGLRKWLETTKA